MDTIAKDIWLSKPVENLLTRCWESLPKDIRSSLIIDILGAPLAGINGFEINQHNRYPDPGQLIKDIDDEIKPIRDSINDDQWSEFIQLITQGLRKKGESRIRAASRIVHLVMWDILKKHETELITKILWQHTEIKASKLPSGTSLYYWVFLFLPELKPNQAEKLFRKKWFGPHKAKDEKSINEVFWNIGYSLVSLRHKQRPIDLTKSENNNLVSLVKKWSELPVPLTDNLWGNTGISHGIAGLQFILSEIDLPIPIAEALLTKINNLNDNNIPAYRLCAALYKTLPTCTTEITLIMRMGLSSNNSDLAEDATLALYTWLELASEQTLAIPEPPVDLLREVGVMIATRRKSTLNRALQIARWIYSSGSPEQKTIILTLTLNGLNFLIKELSYTRDHEEDEDIDIPLLRWGCAHLALAMSASGYGTDQSVIDWVEICNKDPLPEVRYAERPKTVFINEEK